MFAFKSGKATDAEFPERKVLWYLDKSCEKSIYAG